MEATQSIKTKLQEYINKYTELWDLFGVIKVIHKGEVVFEQAYGYASIEFDIKNNMNSCFSLASISKQFTAFAIMLLHDKKLLNTDHSANLYLPTHMKINEAITIHHLLSHTSGLYNFYNFDNNFFANNNRLDYDQNVFFNEFINKKPTNSPGLSYDYNNSNYNLLAWIIEHVSGEKFEEFINNNIFSPLNMINSKIDDGCKPIKNKSTHYVRDFDSFTLAPYHNEKFSVGAGAIVSNCEDLFKWYICLRDRLLLSEDMYNRFFNENKNSYCYGLEHHYIHNTNSYLHGGDHLGVSTFMQNFFDEDSCIIILSNNEDINQYRLGEAISNILHGINVDLPARHDERRYDELELKKYCGTYLKNKIEIKLINGKLYYTRFLGNLHIEIYPIGEGLFVRRYYDQIEPYKIVENDNGIMTFFGYSMLAN